VRRLILILFIVAAPFIVAALFILVLWIMMWLDY
jgi:hypothetical protein